METWQQRKAKLATRRAPLQWELDRDNAAIARAEFEARCEARRLAAYDAQALMIGCEENPAKQRVIYGHIGEDRELYGIPASTRDGQADKAFSLGEW